MRCLLVLVAAFMLSGCWETVPVKRNFPDIPPSLKTGCPDLQKIPVGTEKMSTVTGIVAENYGQYHECRAKVDGWLEWYTDQKKIFESVK